MLKTPDKQHLNQDELSPSKSGSTMKSMDIVLDMVQSPSFSQQFGDDFEFEDVVEVLKVFYINNKSIYFSPVHSVSNKFS